MAIAAQLYCRIAMVDAVCDGKRDMVCSLGKAMGDAMHYLRAIA